ncbi:MAG: carbohydrate transporter permease [Microbacteriaceae bacterium]|jgi:multiple sugar transport system permease protein|nr:carbohydrate transporter permease [Microbacteriaceae bacterium]
MSTSSVPIYLREKRTPLRLTLTILGWALIVVVALFVIFPFVWMVLTSFKTEKDVFALPAQLWPAHWSLEGYANIWKELPFARLFLNSVIFAGGVTVISVLFDSMAAYALARLDFPGKNIAFFLVIGTLMVPYQITLIPLFQMIFDFHWLDTYQGLIVPRATSAFGIFLLRQFFVSVPRDLDSAARIDGAGEFRIYAQIMMPLAKPALATLAVFQFMNNWNDFLWPLVVTSNTDMRTIPAGLTLFGGQYVVDYAVLMAGATISLLPLAIAFFLAQRYFVQGIATTGLK